MKTKTNWKLFFLLVGIGIAGAGVVLPFTFALEQLPDNAPPLPILAIASLAQSLVILAIVVFFGLKMAQRVGFKMPFLEGIAGGEKQPGYLKKIAWPSILWGLGGGVLSVILCIPFWQMSIDLMKSEMGVSLWKAILACFEGGGYEEILFRLFVMTFIVWISFKIKKNKEGGPTKTGIWIAIILTGILFGLGHLPITSSLTSITAPVIIRAVLLNGSLSVIYGWLYWKKGLESAMIAHFSTDVVLHLLIPHLIAYIFI